MVAYAIAGSMNIDITTDPLGTGKDGKPVYLKDIWPSNQEIAEIVRKHVITPQMFLGPLLRRVQGRRELAGHRRSKAARPMAGTRRSTYVQNPPYFEGMTMTPEPVTDIDEATRPRRCSSTRSPPTTSRRPARSRRRRRPASIWSSARWRPRDFNSYGARRGNHEVMMRGTFANIRIKNQMVPGVEGGFTKGPDGAECRSTMPPWPTRSRARRW